MNPARRGVLGGLVALAAPVLPAMASTPSTDGPDAALLTACASYMAKEAAYNAAFRQQCDAEEAGNRAEERRLDAVQHALALEQQVPLGVIIETMATTPAGRSAKAGVAMTLIQTDRDGAPLSREDALIWSLAEDLAGRPLEPPA